jgi:hypothetical protein
MLSGGALLLQFWPWIVATGAALFGLFKWRSSIIKCERAKQAQSRLDASTEADKIDDAIAGMSDAEVLKGQAKWSRPKR